MRTDGQTGMTKLIFAFWNFANVPKKCKQKPVIYNTHKKRWLGTAAVLHTQQIILSCQYCKPVRERQDVVDVPCAVRQSSGVNVGLVIKNLQR
jgi:hypothetical protein